MFNESEIRHHVETQVQKAVQSQRAEFKRWEYDWRNMNREQGYNFSWEMLAEEPRRMFPWMLRQRKYLDPIYDWAVNIRFKFPVIDENNITGLVKNLAGKTNEVPAYFNYAAENMLGEEPITALNHTRTQDLIRDDGKYTVRMRPTVPREVEGRLLGGYDPDASVATEDGRRLKSLFEASLQINDANPRNKGENRRIAGKQHPHLIDKTARVDLGVPKYSPARGSHSLVDLHELSYTNDDGNMFLEQVFWNYKPKNNSETIAQILPELTTDPRLQLGVLSLNRPRILVPGYSPV